MPRERNVKRNRTKPSTGRDILPLQFASSVGKHKFRSKEIRVLSSSGVNRLRKLRTSAINRGLRRIRGIFHHFENIYENDRRQKLRKEIADLLKEPEEADQTLHTLLYFIQLEESAVREMNKQILVPLAVLRRIEGQLETSHKKRGLIPSEEAEKERIDNVLSRDYQSYLNQLERQEKNIADVMRQLRKQKENKRATFAQQELQKLLNNSFLRKKLRLG